MAPIYSTQLTNSTHTSGAITVYTVAGGATVVVTDIDIYLENGAANEVSYVSLRQTRVVYHKSAAAEVTTMQWNGKQVLNAADTIQLVTAATSVRIAITGYVLT